MKTYTFRTIIEPDENGTFHAYAPALPGCHTWGTTLEDAKMQLQDAMQGYLTSLEADGEPIPQDIGYEVLSTVTVPNTLPSYA